MKRPTILLLHGWIRAASANIYYANTITAFEKKGYMVVAPDMPGFGVSKMPTRPLTLGDYADFIHEYMGTNHLHPDMLVGHSFGGRVIIEYLSRFPFHGKAVVMTGTPGYPPVRKAKMVASLIIAKVGNAVFSLPLLSKFSGTIRGWFYYVVGARDFYRASGAMRQTFKNIVTDQLDGKMKKMHIPTLLLWGSADEIVPVSVAGNMQKAIPGSTLSVIPSFGHGVIIDAADRFVEEVQKFIQTI